MQANFRNVFQIAVMTMAVMFLVNQIKPRSRFITRVVNGSAGTAQSSGLTFLQSLRLTEGPKGAGIFT